QYGQVLRVSVVRAIFNPCVCAYTGRRSNPNADNPAAPATLVMNVLRETSMRRTPLTSHSWGLRWLIRLRGFRGSCFYSEGIIRSFSGSPELPARPGKGAWRLIRDLCFRLKNS